MEPSPSFSLVLVSERQKIEVFFCQQKGKIEFCQEFCGKREKQRKRKTRKKEVHSILNFYLSKFSFSSFSSSSITIVSLISQRPTAQKDFLLYIRRSSISSSSIPSFSSSIFLLLLQIEHASGQVSLDRPRVNAVSSRVRLRVHGRLRDVHL